MQKSEYHILCTNAFANSSLLKEAAQQNIILDELSFIHTSNIHSEAVRTKIKTLATQKRVVVFTSSNAVEAVAEIVTGIANWKIYCIGHKTKQVIEEKFDRSFVAGTADEAAGLAERIINDKAKEVIFFCGNQRRDELPEQLKNHQIGVEEIIVYETLETPHVVSKKYDGLLFFSPSAVHSFFKLNGVPAETQLFALGATTREAIQQYTTKNVILPEKPSKENLVRKAIAFFSTQKV